MDERYDMCRSVRDPRYVYIRNYHPRLPHGQHLNYLFQTPTTQAWRREFDAGSLKAEHAQYWLPRAKEELYDLQNDPFELHNLATNEAHQAVLLRMRRANQDHMTRIGDLGMVPEAEMHRLAAGQSPRDWMPEELPASVQQYWRIQAYLEQPKVLSSTELQWLKDHLVDPSHSLNVAAAEVLASCTLADSTESSAVHRQARSRLLELADPRRQPFFASVAAWNAMQRVEGWTATELQVIAKLATKPESIPKVLSNYLPRLRERFMQTHEADQKVGNDE